MRSVLPYIFFVLLISLLSNCFGKSQEEIDAAAQQLFETKKEELQIMADEACMIKRADYVEQYKDSIAQSNLKVEIPMGDE